MIKKFVLFFFLVLCLSGFTQNVIKGKELFENPEKFNNKSLTVVGECIGDFIEYNDDVWINIKTNDGYFLGVVINKNDVNKIKYLGRYRVKGDIIKVSGIFHANCPVHFGEMDIHSESIEVLQRGEVYSENIDKKKIFLSLILSFTTLFFIYYFHKLARRDNVV